MTAALTRLLSWWRRRRERAKRFNAYMDEIEIGGAKPSDSPRTLDVQ